MAWTLETARRATILLATAALLSACLPEAVTAEGARVRTLYYLFLVAAAAVFVLVVGLVAWSLVRYRATDDGRQASRTHQHIRLELLWWALPTLLVFGLIAASVVVLADVDRRTDDPALTVNVTGFQWQWQFAYEGTDRVITGVTDEPPVVVLPVGRRIAFNLESPDVIHSFWVPQFLIKRDVVPGRTNRVELTIDEAGTYRGVCGEFCGLLHDRMLFSIEAVPADRFDAWLRSGSAAP